MILEECVRKQPKKKCLYIGTATGYIFIGTVRQYQEEIDRVDEDLKASFKLNAFSVAGDLWCAIDKLARVDSTEEKVEHWEKVNNRMAALESIAKRALAYKGLRTRRVKSVCDLERGRQILVDGSEHGNFWSEEEYEAVYRKPE